jgi:hypothetical protein
MKLNFEWRFRLGQILFGATILIALVVGRGIRAGDESIHMPTDWSHRHMVFSPAKTWEQQARISRNERYRQQLERRKAKDDDEHDDRRWRRAPENPGLLKGDWSEDLGSGATAGTNHFPAKFSFDTTTSNCANAAQPDFVVYNTSLAGSATQATVVAYDNLYSSCPITSVPFPNVYWAYNTGATGAVVTSPVLSLDGTQVAFMQQVTGGAAELVLLKWAASPTPPAGVTGTFASGSTTVTIVAGTITASDVGMQISGTSIPSGDTIAGVTGSPVTSITLATATTGLVTVAEALTIAAETPATPAVPPTVTNANYRACTAPCMTTIVLNDAFNVAGAAAFHSDTFSSPFYNYQVSPSVADTLYVGDDDGYLHKFTGVFVGTPAENCNNSAGTVPTCAVMNATYPFHSAVTPLSSPVFDPGTGRVFVFSMYCQATVTAPCQTNSGGVTSGGSGPKVHAICDAVVTGSCAAVGNTFASGALGPAASSCSGGTTGNGVNMLVDAPIVDGTTETLYVVVSQDGSGHSALYQLPATFAALACGNNVSPVTMNEEVTLGTGSTTGLRIFMGDFDNAFYAGGAGHMYVCGNTGGNATLYQVAVPASGVIVNPTTAAVGPALTTATVACGPVTEFFNPGGTGTDYMFVSVTASAVTGGTVVNCPAASGCLLSYIIGSTPAPPAWSTTFARTAAITEAGGTSGIVIDNSAAVVGASQVYFTPLMNQTCPTSGGSGGCAIQASQSALN